MPKNFKLMGSYVRVPYSKCVQGELKGATYDLVPFKYVDKDIKTLLFYVINIFVLKKKAFIIRPTSVLKVFVAKGQLCHVVVYLETLDRHSLFRFRLHFLRILTPRFEQCGG